MNKSLSIQISEAILAEKKKPEILNLKNQVAINVTTDKSTKLTGKYEVVGSSDDGTIVSDSKDELFLIKE